MTVSSFGLDDVLTGLHVEFDLTIGTVICVFEGMKYEVQCIKTIGTKFIRI